MYIIVTKRMTSRGIQSRRERVSHVKKGSILEGEGVICRCIQILASLD